MGTRKFRRVLLKLSGEALREPGSADNISPPIVEDIAAQIKQAHQTGLEIALVVGGGNFWRGVSASNKGMERATADYMGMLATVMNSLAVQSMLEAMDVPTRVQSAIEMKNVAEPFIRRVAMRHLELGRVVIFAAGTGNPFFSTDTTGALRASEMGADCVLKATNRNAGKRHGQALTGEFLTQNPVRAKSRVDIRSNLRFFSPSPIDFTFNLYCCHGLGNDDAGVRRDDDQGR